MNLKDIFLAVLVAFIWGLNFIIIKIGLVELPPLLFSALRFGIVAFPAVLFIPFPRTSFWNVVGVGIILGILKFGLLFVAMNIGMSAGLASLLLQIQVLFTISLSFIIFKELMSISQIVGMLISISGFSFFCMNRGDHISHLGLLLVILAAFAWAISNLIMKRMKGVNLLNFMVWVSLVPPIPLFVLSYNFESNTPLELLMSTTAPTWLSIAYVGFISTFIAFSIWGKLLKNYSAATVTPFALLIPVVGLLASGIILNEKLVLTELVGTVLVMSGLALCVLGTKCRLFLKNVKNKNSGRNMP